ncbi:hypothetical protein LZG04_18735 [Saccharothrix sp. S26]|uniref:hypothetical protein n=1 Tax=Saccharothrix sp. S26 TaxID=2907215 RepID=UPI001F2E4BC1|nr:hypothetical protein [Saccharothrix sp. S26]MCE6996825.1 hypothetical protein [Saccharothrix sp. S26]
MTTNTAAKTWIPVVAWTQLTLGTAGLVAFLASPAAAVVVTAVAALIGLARHALLRASRDLDRILAEELDR